MPISRESFLYLSSSDLAENILVCLAWPYANGSLHVGHLAGVYVPADIFARYHRLRGNNVLMNPFLRFNAGTHVASICRIRDCGLYCAST